MRYFLLIALLVASVPSMAQLTPGMEGSKIMNRFTDYKMRRVPQGVTLPQDVRAKLIDEVRRMERAKFAEGVQDAQPEWKAFGPRSTGGRIKNILVHPDNRDWIYVAAAAGGVWKSEDAGGSWNPIMDDANAIALGSIWFDPTDPSIIYAGTGEQVTNANTYLGAGVMRTTNDGKTWETVGLTHVGSISRIYAHPKNRDLLMVSALNANGGVYKSLDRGVSWEKLYDGNVYDMSINPDDEDDWFLGVQDEGIVYTSNGGQTWQTRMTGLFGTIGRSSVQQSPVNTDVLYCLIELNNLASIARTTNRGQSWEIQYSDPRGCFFSGSCNPASSQGFYDNYISVSPHDEDVCFEGGIDIWRTTNGGT